MYKENTLFFKILFGEGLKGGLITFFNNTFVVFILRFKPMCILFKEFKKKKIILYLNADTNSASDSVSERLR